jgi:hypothetical protein
MRLVTPCEQGACIALERLGADLVMSTTNGGAQMDVTAAEVRQFAAAVQSGYFDELLGQSS